ncbi:glycosyltransferase family 1 protein [Algoriphagus sp.]|uniref:glycosyltransferase family 4 protein n=1 Tax=Algoriphagus sp. TaxID=1872435 RepID=UPI002731CF0A|nr:glycosyltransferase family 1 protein [Algoriphagus sp.]MDP2040495.1 glycosyltransferase family 1 protein [Algoriphagus sp.]
MKIIYDITVLGLHGPHEENKTGVYRVIEDLFNSLNQIKELELGYSHSSFMYYNEYSKKYLKDRGLKPELVFSSRPYFRILPRSIFGKGHRYFNYLYKNLGIKIDREHLVYNKRDSKEYSIFHSPFYPIPDEIQAISGIKTVITIYDLIPILFPKLHPLKGQIEKTIESIGDGYAICISECTKNDLLKYNPKLDPNKVFVAMLAASPKIFYKDENPKKFEDIREKYSIPRKYFLSLSTLEPRKNIDHLIRSFVKFIKEYQIEDLSLVLVGTKGWMFDKIFEEFDNAGELKSKIILTGRIPDEDLAIVYSNAHSFYYMSLYEGFGLPPLEAMQCGVATVTSNTSSLPEVVGDGGITLDPTNQEELVKVMNRLYSDDLFKDEMKEKALIQAAKFSWDICAARYFQIYKQIQQF